jgi:hypothetical protein
MSKQGESYELRKSLFYIIFLMQSYPFWWGTDIFGERQILYLESEGWKSYEQLVVSFHSKRPITIVKNGVLDAT